MFNVYLLFDEPGLTPFATDYRPFGDPFRRSMFIIYFQFPNSTSHLDIGHSVTAHCLLLTAY